MSSRTLTSLNLAGPARRPPTRDPEMAQGRRWLNNELRKPGLVDMTQNAIDDFNGWTKNPRQYAMGMTGGQAMRDGAAATRDRFLMEREQARRAQGVQKGARDWWTAVPGKKARASAKGQVETDSGQQGTDAGLVEGVQQMTLEDDERRWECDDGSGSSVAAPEPVSRHASEERDEVL
ncbi:MAG: hypothetical protein Q9225_006151 [Loekoesia sp. 1 TL-2023]